MFNYSKTYNVTVFIYTVIYYEIPYVSTHSATLM